MINYQDAISGNCSAYELNELIQELKLNRSLHNGYLIVKLESILNDMIDDVTDDNIRSNGKWQARFNKD